MMKKSMIFKKVIATALTVVLVAISPITANANGVYKENDKLQNYMEHVIRDDSNNSVIYFQNNPTGQLPTTITDVADINNSLLALGYNNDFGPVVVSAATLNKNGSATPVYVIALKGTDLNDKVNAVGIDTDIVVGFQNPNNAYTRSVVDTIVKSIPEGSNLMFYGHSLGGMVAQQIIADSQIKANYNVLYTVTFGSPIINGCNREGIINRLGDTSDPIPYLSVTGKFVSQVFGLQREDGGFTKGLWTISQGWNAHCNSYNKKATWGAYDVTGVKGGKAYLELNPETICVARAPKNFK